ncbi:MAG: type IX secretion system sortase PorU [Candidatus Krumholzibacteria bacterium]|nr:type IX secretion system sortase PorU [Candidatus Krumholzibacteria bacterium]MDH4336622.1 type IX secretion system sortase PorU [Candidatus Krumholzibacteria bacterium]MDH5268965.1 type IX secretion system sortase PorU [Candidatus Krumholzibacteria bacterium]
MRSVKITIFILALCALTAAGSVYAGGQVRTVSDSNGRVVIELTSESPDNQPVIQTFFVAISPGGTWSVDFEPGAGAAIRADALADTIIVSQPFIYRGTRALWVRVSVPAGLPLSTVTVDYTPAAEVRDASTVDPLLKALVVNTDVFPVTPRSGSPDPWFSRSPNWARLTLASRGMYAVTGADLSAAGVSLAGIDPATLRAYTGGVRMQARDLTDANGSWQPGQAMREVPLRVEAGSDGTFDASDRIVFYAVGAEDWADYYGPAADTLHYRHSHAKSNTYFLSWGGALGGTPLRMAGVAAVPVAAPDRTTYFHREYRERDLISDFDYRGDGWLWLDVPRPGNSRYGLVSIDVRDLVASRPQVFRSVALAPYVSANDPTGSNIGHHALYLNLRGGVERTVGGLVWNAQVTHRYFEDGVPVRISGDFLLNGANQFRLQVPGDLNPIDKMFFAWFSIGYERRIRAVDDAIAFSSPDTSGVVNFSATSFTTQGTLYAFDVTDPWSPFELTGAEVTPSGGGRRVRFSSSLAAERRHYWVGSGGALRKPSVTRVTPVDLRNESAGPNMLIVCHAGFRAAAERLRAHRAAHLPFYGNPSVKVVTTDEIFDNFSAGLPDPMAIRNYIKFLYENAIDANGNPRLGYVLLLGDATVDFRNNASAQPDYVPTNLYFTRTTLFAMATDDWFAHMDASDQVGGASVMDVALGRLPVESAEEASIAVDKVIGYELDSPRETWRDEIILVADDELSSFESACETSWTDESEAITYTYAANYLTVRKIYLTEYAQIGSVKPQSRLEFLDEWNQGALVVNYIGHGSSQQMADEQVFLGSDVSQLNNGLRLPVVMAFSCTIGDFANPAGKSLSEKLIVRAEGGAVATMTASRETYPGPNAKLNAALFKLMTPRWLGDTDAPIGVAAMASKLHSAAETYFQPFQEENNWKYNLLGDPAMRPAIARQALRFETTGQETLVAGARHVLRGRVLRDGATDAGFTGAVTVTVREPRIRRAYQTRCNTAIVMNYDVPGGVIYSGSADVHDGEFEVSFRVPRLAATGPLAFAAAYADAGGSDAAEAIDSVLVVAAPTLADSLALKQLDGAPRVELGFKSGLKVVKPGDTVRALVRDQDGINILATTNEGRQAILIDDLPVPIDVNKYFSFDHGGVDTSGVLLFPLPDLDVGKHRLVYKVSDSFGATALDTLFFDVTDAQDYYAQAVMNYPNPFQTSTQFLFRLSNRASVTVDIFTVSGKRVRRIEQIRDGGEVWIEWDGRDAAGDDIANGSYLYVATVDFVGLDRPPTVLRGKLTRIR